MVKSSNSTLIFVISNSNFIGITIEAYIAETNSLGKFNLKPQKVNAKTIPGYSGAYTSLEMEILKLIYNCEEEMVVKKFSVKKMEVAEFFKATAEKKFNTL